METGTRAAAAGGYCGVVAMPNTEPPLDSTPLLLALRETARARGPGAGRVHALHQPGHGR